MKKYSVTYSFLSRVKNGFWRPDLYPLEKFLKKYFGVHNSGYFVKIGANDGLTDDPTTTFFLDLNWSGLFVEPLPDAFEKLIENLKHVGDRFTFENLGIGRSSGTIDLYYIDEKIAANLPGYVSLSASFNDAPLEKIVKDHQLDEHSIKNISINTVTLDELLFRHSVGKLNLLQIDAEGMDGEILNSYSFSIVPELIIFEHVHLDKNEYKRLCAKLKKLKYYLFYWGRDTFALQLELKKRHIKRKFI